MAEKFCLKWNDFNSNVSKSFGFLRNEDFLHDVTLVGDDYKQISAHRLVLSASSEYFKEIFKNNKHSHPLLCLDGINNQDMMNILDYIYNGEVQIYQDDLDRFLTVAQRLRLQGLLSNNTNNEHEKDTYKEECQEIKNEEVPTERSITVKERPIVRDPTKNKDTIVAVSIDQENCENVNEKLGEHMEKCEDGSYRCKLCGKTCGLMWTMRYHIETHINGLSFSCPICQKSFRSRNSLSSHKSQYHK